MTKNKPYKTPSPKINIHKSNRYILLVLGISWVFGFSSTIFFDFHNPIAKSIIMLIFAFIPATIALIINKKEKGTFKNLKFFKPSVKNALWAFLIPIIYFGIIISTQILFKVRSFPDWSIIGSPLKTILVIILGYPITALFIMGEEIGWRGYLQEKVIYGYGAVKGIFILGLIWGLWHMPIALQGYNFPNHPYLEAFITYPLVGMALSLIIAYLGFNKHSIFIGIIIHASNNHFGSIILAVTETQKEFVHAMIFNIFYVIIIALFGFLWWKKNLYNKKSGVETSEY